jgi:hypothetical protein
MGYNPIAKPTFPNIPASAGAPSVIATVDEVIFDVVLAVADALILINALTATRKWGLFSTDGSLPDITGDTIVTFDFSQDARILSYPTELGSFNSYNKVRQPIEMKLEIAVAKTAANRALLTTNLNRALLSTGTYNMRAPDHRIPICNVKHFSYSRSAQKGGASMIVFEVWVEEVRLSASATFSNPKDPAASTMQTNNQSTASQPTATQSNALTAASSGAGQG